MIKKFATGIAGAALMLSSPALAQDEMASEDVPSEEMTEAEMTEFVTMMGSIFQAEPLTADQEARLPVAQQVVEKMMPEGFYGKMMGDMMDSFMQPLFGILGGPDVVVSERFVLPGDRIESLNEEQVAEIARIVDPAYEGRGSAISDAMAASMADAFTVLEQPMRDGLSKAYAARFDDTQLSEISNFFATPAGSAFATESVSIWTDPQVMQSMMGSLPAIMGSFGGMEQSIEEAMSSIPQAKTYEELSASERSRLGQLLGLKEAELKASMEEASIEDAAEGDWEE